MDDLISRQAAIEAICKVCQLVENYKKCDGYPETSTWCDELVALRAVPSAQPEPPKEDEEENRRMARQNYYDQLSGLGYNPDGTPKESEHE